MRAGGGLNPQKGQRGSGRDSRLQSGAGRASSTSYTNNLQSRLFGSFRTYFLHLYVQVLVGRSKRTLVI